MNLNHYLELLCLLIAIVNYKSLSRNTVFIYFIPFLAITAFVELYAIGKDRTSKTIFYNFFLLFEFLFYAFIYYYNLRNVRLKKYILFSCLVFLAFYLINLFFVYGLYEFHSYTSILSSFLKVIFICMFFYETILPETLSTSLFLKPFFWVNVGLIFFSLGSVILLAMVNFLSSIDLQNKGIVVFKVIIKILNVILYGSLSLAFILCRNNKKTSLPPS